MNLLWKGGGRGWKSPETIDAGLSALTGGALGQLSGGVWIQSLRSDPEPLTPALTPCMYRTHGGQVFGDMVDTFK